MTDIETTPNEQQPVAPSPAKPKVTRAVASTVGVLALIAGFGLGHVTGSGASGSTAACHEAFTHAEALFSLDAQNINLAGAAIQSAAAQDAAAVNAAAEVFKAMTPQAAALRNKYNAAKVDCP